jgi:hypothetical protein
MPLETLRKGLCRAWRRLQQSRQWRDARDDCEVEHLIRAHEITLGDNGWHPHVHVMMFARYPDLLDAWQRRLMLAWKHAVECEMGAECVPSATHALKISTCRDDYIAKMALEVASSATKQGRQGNFNPWQIAKRIVEGDERPEVWEEYAAGMRGCHQLQWSRGLREALAPTEPDLACLGEEPKEKEVIAEIPRETWREMCNEPGSLWTLHDFGKSTELSGNEARDWLREFFENRCGTGNADWRWVNGRAYLSWLDTS